MIYKAIENLIVELALKKLGNITIIAGSNNTFVALIGDDCVEGECIDGNLEQVMDTLLAYLTEEIRNYKIELMVTELIKDNEYYSVDINAMNYTLH